MNHFIKNIHINKLFHLSDLDIPITDEKYPHLIITGKNGSGKTVLLNAISDFLDIVKGDSGKGYIDQPKKLKSLLQVLANSKNMKQREEIQRDIDSYINKRMTKISGRVNIHSDWWGDILVKSKQGDFITTFYQADRKIRMIEPKNPTKPVYRKNGNVRETATSQFLNFLSDLKIQQALARNEKLTGEADEIGKWFEDFEKLLKEIFQDNNLKIEFNYKNYGFKIITNGKKFKFTQVSDGFAAVLDIVADLVLKMQGENSLSRTYHKEGVVLIDEIETHLHLELQKLIMPLLTKVFPNIQFIVTTHSPFVLSSMPNAIAYDLEKQQVLDDLTEYSYEALAEGYFGVKTQASYLEMKLNDFKELLAKDELTDAEMVELKQLKSDFEKINEAVSPLIVGEFQNVLIQNTEKIRRWNV